MNTIDASLRNTKTSGEVNKLRSEGNVPGIVYGGKFETQKTVSYTHLPSPRD